MGSTYTAGTATLDVVPSMRDFHRKIAADIKTIGPAEIGVTANTRQAIRDIAAVGRQSPTVQVQVKADKAAAERALREVAQAEEALTNARGNSEDAGKRVEIAEKALAETRTKSGANSSKAAAAELKLSQAHRASAAAVNDVRNAEAKLSAARQKTNQPGFFGIGGGNGSNGGGFAADAGTAIKFLSSMADEIGGVIKNIASLAEIGSDAGGSVAKGASQGASALGNMAGAAESAGGPIVALAAAGATIAIIGTVGTVAAASLIGVADAAVTASGALFLIPAGLSIAGAGIGTLFIGTMGLSDAFDALGKAQQNSAKDAQASAKAQRSAADQVESAELSLSRAQADAATSRENSARQVADAVKQERRAEVDAARDIVQADRAVLDAEKSLNQARDDLTRATEDAVKAQRDLNLQLRGGALDAQEAALDLADAQTELNDAQKQGVAGEDLARLQIAYERAKLRVDETTASNKDLTEQQDDYAKKGVAANDAVASATEAVQRAEQQLSDAREQADYTREQSAQRVQDAVEAVADAERSRDQAAIQAARSIADAERSLEQAHQNAADTLSELSSSEQAVADAMGALSPNAQKFVDTVWALKPAWDAVKTSVQDALFAGMDDQIIKLSGTYLPLLHTRLTGISDAAHDAAIDIVDLLTDPGHAGQVNDVLKTTEDIVRQIGKVVSPLINAFLDLSEVGAEVFEEDVLPAIQETADGFAKWVKGMKDSGDLKTWMSGAVGVIRDMVGWAFKLGDAFVHIIGSLSAGVKQSGFFDTLGDTLQKFIDFTNSKEGQEFFYEIGLAIGIMASMITGALGVVIDFVKTLQQTFDVVKDIFNLDFGDLSTKYGSGVGSIMEAIKTAIFGGGIFGLFDKLFDVDWSAIWDKFRSGTGQILTTIFSSIIPAPVKSLLEGMFHLNWDVITKAILAGLNNTLGAIGKAIRDSPVGKFLSGLFGESHPAITNPYLFLPGFANPMGRADGGPVVGPGGPRSDSVPIWASNGEFVVNAAATSANRGLLEWINAGKFANGGVIGGGTASTVAGGATSLTIDVGALANLGDVAETVTELVAELNAELATLVADTAGYWLQLVSSITTADNAISARQTLLQQQTVYSWATMQTAVWASTTGQIAAITNLMTGLGQLRSAMSNTADWAVTQFGRVSAAAADPIRWVLQFPFNQGLITAWNQLNTDFALGKPVAPIPLAFAAGGSVWGPGTGTSDDILARLSNGEFVIREDIARRTRPFLEALNSGQGEALEAAGVRRYATGGAVVADTGSGLNATVLRGQQFLRAQAGKPYVWGGVGPDGYDCSGLVSAVANVLRGESTPYRRLGVAASQPWAGFVRGLSSSFATGFNGHHTALTLGGLNGEAQTFGVPVLVGPRASGADSAQFTGTASLPIVGGRFVPGGGPGADPASILASAFAQTLQQVDTIADMWPGNHAAAAAEGMMRQSIASLTKIGTDQLTSMLFTSGVAGSPEVIAAVRAVARTFGWGDGAQWDALQQLVSHESGFNPNAANPTSSARGLFQKLTSVNGPIEPTIQGQTQWGLNYIAGRYGTPLAAWSAWQSRNPHWYDAGGLANGVGLMPKNVIEPERVLSPPQTRAFEAAMARIGRTGYERADLDGTTAPTVVHQTINPSPGMDETDVGRAAGRFVVHSLRKI